MFSLKNVCLVGYGKIGPNHANAFDDIENARLYAVCDINEEKIKKCQEAHNVVGYTDFDEMLKDENIHSVHICTPHYLHFEMIVKALRAGKTVVSEKPVTMTKEQFDELEKIEGSDKVAVVFQNRLNACVVRLKEIIDSGEMGSIVAAKSVLTWYRNAEYYNEGKWRGNWDTEGGGVLINQAVHSLDLLYYLVGNITSVKANMMNYSLENVIEVEDTFTAYLGFENGVKGLFFATNAYSVNSAMDIEIVFEKGNVRYMNGRLFVNNEIVASDKASTAGKSYWGAGHRNIIKNFYDKGMYYSISDAKNTMNTIFAMYESARSNGIKINI